MRIVRRQLHKGLAVIPALGAWPALAQSGSTMQQIKERKVLRVGAAPGDPWFYKDPMSEKWAGVGVMLGEQMAKDLGVQFALVETTWANAPAAIQANQLDVQFVLDATEARRKAIDFPDAPLFYYAMGALLRPDLAAKSWADIDRPDLKVGVTLGTSVDTTLTGMLKNAKIERFASNDESVAALVARRVDVVSQFHPALQRLRQFCGKLRAITIHIAQQGPAGAQYQSASCGNVKRFAGTEIRHKQKPRRLAWLCSGQIC